MGRCRNVDWNRYRVSLTDIAAGAHISSMGHLSGTMYFQCSKSFECQYPPEIVTNRKYSPRWLTITGSAPAR